MNVNPIFQPHAAASNSSSSSDTTGTTNDMFLQLLTTQLKNQSPLDPVDPNQFVNQMVQLNTLNQIVSIRQLLEQINTPATTSHATKHVQGGQ